MYMPVFDTNHIQKTIVQPLSMYEKKHDDTSLKEIQDAIRIASMMVSGFRDILDDLNFDEKKLRKLQFDLDDNYDAVEKVLKTTSDFATREMMEKLLTQMAKLDMEIGDLILEHHHAS
jgi:light-regulated signal transduction histidine kinase (bacteriophytochrome)